MILKSNSGTCIIIYKMRLNLFSQKQVTCQEKYKIASCHEEWPAKKVQTYKISCFETDMGYAA